MDNFAAMQKMAATEKLDIIVAPSVVSQYLVYKEFNERVFNFNITYSDFIGYFEADVIAAMEYPGKIPMFAYFSCFEKEVWLLIIASIVVLSLISSIDGKTFDLNSNIFDIFSNFMVLLISKAMKKSIIKKTSGLILSVWVLSALVLSNQFTAEFTDFMVTAVPMVRIDSFEDLVKHKDMKIVVRADDSFTVYVRQKDTPLKRSLSSMLDPYLHNDEIMNKLAKGLKDQSYSYVTKRDMLIFFLSDIAFNYDNQPSRLFDILHISEKTNFYEPYLFLINNDGPNWIKINLNRMCDTNCKL